MDETGIYRDDERMTLMKTFCRSYASSTPDAWRESLAMVREEFAEIHDVAWYFLGAWMALEEVGEVDSMGGGESTGALTVLIQDLIERSK